MATTKERILVTLTPEMAKELRIISKREKTPRATAAAQLIRRALEDDEDRRLSVHADLRASDPGKLLSSDAFWKEVEKVRKHA